MATLIEHAKREMRLAGLYDEGNSYDGLLTDSVVQLIEIFASQRHSGYSAELVSELFSKLSRFGVLSPITSNPDEWDDVSEYNNEEPLWQNNRDSKLFSKNNGRTWYNIENDLKKIEEDIDY